MSARSVLLPFTAAAGLPDPLVPALSVLLGGEGSAGKGRASLRRHR
jgi:hypothetical protein